MPPARVSHPLKAADTSTRYKTILSISFQPQQIHLTYNQYFFQQEGSRRISMGNNSSLPASMSKISTHFEK